MRSFAATSSSASCHCWTSLTTLRGLAALQPKADKASLLSIVLVLFIFGVEHVVERGNAVSRQGSRRIVLEPGFEGFLIDLASYKSAL